MNSASFSISRISCFLLAVVEALSFSRSEQTFWSSVFFVLSCSDNWNFVCNISMTASDRVCTTAQFLCFLAVHKLHNSTLQTRQKYFTRFILWMSHNGRLSFWRLLASKSSIIEMKVRLVSKCAAHFPTVWESFLDCIGLWHIGQGKWTTFFPLDRFWFFELMYDSRQW